MLTITPYFIIPVLGAIVLGLAYKSTPFRPVFFVISLSVFLSILVTPHPSFDSVTNYHVGLLGSHILASSFNLLVLESNPQETLNHNKQDKAASQLGFFSRLIWASSLLFNVRGANWSYAVRGLRYPQYKSRFGFVLYQLMWAGFYYLLADLVGAITRDNPALQYPPTESLHAHGLAWQVANVLLFWLTLITFQDRSHMLLSVVTVALGLSDPEDWPAYFGVWPNTTSVRTFWGRSWHQCLRRSIQPQSKYFIDIVLRLPSNSVISTYTELFACFFLSGVYHALRDWLVQRNRSTALINIEFFILQAFGIMLEDFLVFLRKRIGIKKVPTIVCYAWVVGWMTVTCPMWIETMVQGNNFSFAPNVSVVGKLLDILAQLALFSSSGMQLLYVAQIKNC
ncbi:membrane bound O-acyl transferase family-domain-containing protein [Cyathus striatus]|nr:membrane bound O-acyl transferase family-domain-containing protein [Cyathus striatus]